MRFVIILLLLFSSLLAQSQVIDTRSLSISDNNISQNFSVSTTEKKLNPKNTLMYFYYRDDKLFQTQGSFSGWLLHGKYESFYPNKSLESQGQFNDGVKNGQWKYWYPNGFLKSVEKWRNGSKTGYFSEYNDKGVLTKTGRYKSGFMSGNVYVYNDRKEIIETHKYKKGLVVQPQPKTKKITIAKTGNQ
jgi:antitoxin component YwqK of YwqJK toxin-antitoxin module